MATALPGPSADSAARSTGGSPLPFAALVLDALAMGISPTFVRIADVGPLAIPAFQAAGGALILAGIYVARPRRPGRGPAS